MNAWITYKTKADFFKKNMNYLSFLMYQTTALHPTTCHFLEIHISKERKSVPV